MSLTHSWHESRLVGAPKWVPDTRWETKKKKEKIIMFQRAQAPVLLVVSFATKKKKT